MSQRISEEADNTEHSHDSEADFAQLPQLPPGVYISAPGTMPHRKTRWPDAIDVIFEKDPACRNIFEALLYQSLWAIFYHRIAHALYKAHIPFLPRFISQFARLMTSGIEIHPGAQIGKRFFIDHGAGIVIGETAVIGNNVMLYHQVTLGATGWWRRGPGRLQKRHPTIERRCDHRRGCRYSWANHHRSGSKIGAMALVLESVPPNSVVASKPAELLVKGGETLEKHEELTQGGMAKSLGKWITRFSSGLAVKRNIDNNGYGREQYNYEEYWDNCPIRRICSGCKHYQTKDQCHEHSE